jgi:hypothetical protein
MALFMSPVKFLKRDADPLNAEGRGLQERRRNAKPAKRHDAKSLSHRRAASCFRWIHWHLTESLRVNQHFHYLRYNPSLWLIQSEDVEKVDDSSLLTRTFQLNCE